MVLTLQEQIYSPTSFDFLQRLQSLAKATPEQISISGYLLGLSLRPHGVLAKHCPSVLAASSLLAAFQRLDNSMGAATLKLCERLGKPSLEQCMAEMLAMPGHATHLVRPLWLGRRYAGKAREILRSTMPRSAEVDSNET